MKILDRKLKCLISSAMRNKIEIVTILDYFDPNDIENGIIDIPELLVNSGLKMRIMDKLQDYVDDYKISFQNNCIYLDIKLHLKQLGPLEAKYIIAVKDFRFSSDYRRIYGTFKEDINSLGNMLQAMALKAACANGSCLQKALRLSNCDFIFVDANNIMVDLDKFDLAKNIPSGVELGYISCENSFLKLKFSYCG